MANLIERNSAEVMRDEMVKRDEIVQYLKEGPKTIPEIARHLNCPTHEATYWVMAMWRYGIIEETGKANAEGYFSYVPKEVSR